MTTSARPAGDVRTRDHVRAALDGEERALHRILAAVRDAGPAANAVVVIEHIANGLDEIDAARRRLAAGTYGTCERCAGPIAEVRLGAAPSARSCQPCADDQAASRGWREEWRRSRT